MCEVRINHQNLLLRVLHPEALLLSPASIIRTPCLTLQNRTGMPLVHLLVS